MGQKVDIAEIQDMSQKISKTRNELEEKFNQLKMSIEQLESLHSFKGETAKISKYYFKDVVVAISDSLKESIIAVDKGFIKDINEFNRSVDQSNQAKLNEDYLVEQLKVIDKQYDRLFELSDRINATARNIQDIVVFPRMNFQKVTLNKNNVTQHLEELLSNLHRFANMKSNEEIVDVLSKVKILLEHINKQQGEARFSSHWRKNSKEADEIWQELRNWSENKRGINDGFRSFKNGIKTTFTTLNVLEMVYEGVVGIHIIREFKGQWFKEFRKTGVHGFSKTQYMRYNNLYSMAELGKIPNKDLVKILKSIRNNPLHPWKAIESAFPYKLDQKPIKNGNIKITTDVSKNTMKSMFDETFKAKEYRRFLQNKNAPKKWNKYKYIGLQGAKELAKKSIGKNPFEALSNLDWKKPKTPNVEVKSWKNPASYLKVSKDQFNKMSNEFKSSNVLGKVSKVAGPIGTGLTVVDNYKKHKDNPQKLIVSTAVDLGSGAAAAAAGAAVGSAFVPPLGTVVGAGVGLGVNALMNLNLGTPPRSAVDRMKDGVKRVVDGTKKAAQDIGNKIKGWFKN